MEPIRGAGDSGGFSEQTDSYLRRVLLERIYSNDEVLFTKTFKPPKGDNEPRSPKDTQKSEKVMYCYNG